MFDISREEGTEPWNSEQETEAVQLTRHSPSSEEFSVQKLQTSTTMQPASSQHKRFRNEESGRVRTNDLDVRPVYYQSAAAPPKVTAATATASASVTVSEHSQHRRENVSSQSVMAKESLDRIQHHIQQLQHMYKVRSAPAAVDGGAEKERE